MASICPCWTLVSRERIIFKCGLHLIVIEILWFNIN